MLELLKLCLTYMVIVCMLALVIQMLKKNICSLYLVLVEFFISISEGSNPGRIKSKT